MPTDEEFIELFVHVLEITATQTAVLRILKELKVDPATIDEAVQKELALVFQMKDVSALRAGRNPALASKVLSAVKSLRKE